MGSWAATTAAKAAKAAKECTRAAVEARDSRRAVRGAWDEEEEEEEEVVRIQGILDGATSTVPAADESRRVALNCCSCATLPLVCRIRNELAISRSAPPLAPSSALAPEVAMKEDMAPKSACSL